MKISSKTKISALIKANPEAIEAIASINSHFNKLRNPILRKVLASRVTIADAARIGGTPEAVFFEKLLPLGFEQETVNNVTASENENPVAPVWPGDLPENVVPMDVREALESGNDPFNQIMDALDMLEPKQALLLINTFEPTPLIGILKKRGFTHFTERKDPDLVHTYFYKTVGNPAKKVPAETQKTEEATRFSFEEVSEKYRANLQEVDVRELEMPLPMVTILEALPKLQPQEALLVYHCRVPQYLIPQLAERGYGYAIKETGPEQVQLIIFKN